MKIENVENKIEYAKEMLEEFVSNWKNKWKNIFKEEDKEKNEIQFNIEAICITHIYHYFVTKILLSTLGADELAYELGILEELEYDDYEKISALEHYTGEKVVFYEGNELFSGKDISIPFLIRQRKKFPTWLDKDEFYTLISAINSAASSYRLLYSEFESNWYERIIKCNNEEKILLLDEFFESLSHITNLKRKEYIIDFSNKKIEYLLKEFGYIEKVSDLIKIKAK